MRTCKETAEKVLRIRKHHVAGAPTRGSVLIEIAIGIEIGFRHAG